MSTCNYFKYNQAIKNILCNPLQYHFHPDLAWLSISPCEKQTRWKTNFNLSRHKRQILKSHSQVHCNSQFVNCFRYFKRQLKWDFFKLAAAINIILPLVCDHDNCELKHIAGWYKWKSWYYSVVIEYRLALWVAQRRLLFASATRSQLNLTTISEFDIASFQTDILTRTAQPTHAVARILFCKNAVPNYYSYLFWLVNIKKDNNLRAFSRCNLKVGIFIVVLPPRECIWIFCCCWYSKWLWEDYSTMTIHNNSAFC